jgi:hypothetical protein
MGASELLRRSAGFVTKRSSRIALHLGTAAPAADAAPPSPRCRAYKVTLTHAS